MRESCSAWTGPGRWMRDSAKLPTDAKSRAMKGVDDVFEFRDARRYGNQSARHRLPRGSSRKSAEQTQDRALAIRRDGECIRTQGLTRLQRKQAGRFLVQIRLRQIGGPLFQRVAEIIGKINTVLQRVRVRRQRGWVRANLRLCAGNIRQGGVDIRITTECPRGNPEPGACRVCTLDESELLPSSFRETSSVSGEEPIRLLPPIPDSAAILSICMRI